MTPQQRPEREEISRRLFLGQMILGSSAALLGACQSSPPASSARGADPGVSPAGPAPVGARGSSEWERLVEAARRDGAVSVYAFSGAAYRGALVDAFEKAYPGIKVQGTFGSGPDNVNRVMTERTANRHLVDLLIHGPGATIPPLKAAGALAPLQTELILPEVLDTSAWFENRLWWADAAEPYTTLMFQGSVNSIVSYNTQQVDPAPLRSYWDLLDPRWKGKMVATDVRNPGPGSVAARFMYKHPDLGPTFMERLFGETDLTLSGDQRQMIDWLAQGRFALALLLHFSEVERAREQGLPVAVLPSERFREGAPIGPAQGAVHLVDQAPHPNAARLYINWLLSREGQIAWQQHTRENSLRIDIPKEGLFPVDIPKPGVQYVDAGGEEYARISGQVLNSLITQAVEKGNR
jgi:ABC-type Fe3+ transport system substrate-binding protein